MKSTSSCADYIITAIVFLEKLIFDEMSKKSEILIGANQPGI